MLIYNPSMSDFQGALDTAVRRGLHAFLTPTPMTLSEWSAEHFYLSAESSYTEGKWEAYPFQVGLMDAMSNDSIKELFFQKSARVGATKSMLAYLGYSAHHRARNVALWQPVDDDSNEFCKSELNTMIRDVKAVQDAFPWYDKKHSKNTLAQKQFISSMLFLRGGKSAKNFRRISVDTALLDELAAFDSDIDGEGSPVKLAQKRTEGSSYPKLIACSTPKIHGRCLMEKSFDGADMQMRFEIPCPHCGHYQDLRFGGKDVPHGFKWTHGHPETTQYCCIKCAGLFDQGDYLDAWERGVWVSCKQDAYMSDSRFYDTDNVEIDAPSALGLHVWTAYSPQTSWEAIVREFLGAAKDRDLLKTFTNTTLGETFVDEAIEKIDANILFARREYYTQAPAAVGAITIGIDVQDDRFELQFDGWGYGEERWCLDYVRLYGDPSRSGIWDKLAEIVNRQFVRDDGIIMSPLVACIDHGGHFSDEVNNFSRRMGVRFMIPIKGSSTYGKPIATFPRKRNRNRVYLTEVGTDSAKDLLFQRLHIHDVGPGYWHFPMSDAFDSEYFRQLTNEDRVLKFAQGQRRFVWNARERRQEPWDCSVYSLAAIRIAQQFFGLTLVNVETKLESSEVKTAKAPAPKKPKSKGMGYGSNWLR